MSIILIFRRSTNMNHIIKRYFFFILGLIINSFGVAFITKSALGTSQISSIPYVLSLQFANLTFGTTTFIINMIFIVLQILILRKDFAPIQFLQIGANLLFSVFIDISMGFLSWMNPEGMVLRLLSLLLGCVILAFGISVEVAPDVIVVPGEGIVRALSRATHQEFGRVKICFDVTLIILATILSFLFFHILKGVGLGTVVSAVAVGPIISWIHKYVPLIDRIPSR